MTDGDSACGSFVRRARRRFAVGVPFHRGMLTPCVGRITTLARRVGIATNAAARRMGGAPAAAVAGIGRGVLRPLGGIGSFLLFTLHALLATLLPPFHVRMIALQFIRIGYRSLPLIALTSFFTGGALAVQIHHAGAWFDSPAAVSGIVGLAITRELGPVLGGLMTAGRVGGSISAELASMRITEQIDALKTLSTDPVRYLVVPRVLAATICMPLLVLVGDVVGIFGGFLIATTSFGFDSAAYVRGTFDMVDVDDVLSGLVKAAVFGFLVSVISAYQGYEAAGGSAGVGRATTNAVVMSSMSVLSVNYMMTSFF